MDIQWVDKGIAAKFSSVTVRAIELDPITSSAASANTGISDEKSNSDDSDESESDEDGFDSDSNACDDVIETNNVITIADLVDQTIEDSNESSDTTVTITCRKTKETINWKIVGIDACRSYASCHPHKRHQFAILWSRVGVTVIGEQDEWERSELDYFLWSFPTQILPVIVNATNLKLLANNRKVTSASEILLWIGLFTL